MAIINDKPLIYWILERIKKSKLLNDIVIATTNNSKDDKFCYWLKNNTNFKFFRGSENDVLKRYYDTARLYSADIIVRVTADDPFKDAKIIDKAINILISGKNIDYCSNTIIPTYPEGLDVEVFTMKTLERAHMNAILKSDREHVTSFITKRPNEFTIKNFVYKKDYSNWRWTIDKPKDLDLTKKIYKHFKKNPLVCFKKIIKYINANPEIPKINEGTVRMEGYLKSLQEDNND